MADVSAHHDFRGGVKVENEAAYREAIARAEERANPKPVVEKEWRYVRNPNGSMAGVINTKTGERRHWMSPELVDG